MIAIRHPGKLTQIRGKALPALTMVENVTLLDQETRRQDVTVEIKTGVMHQIRCHLSELNWPIDGDPIYHGAPAERLWLHAWRIELPIIGQTIGRPEKKEARLLLEARLPDHWPRS